MSNFIPANETPADITPVRRALISVSDKNGIVEFAQALHAAGVEILSTGGTYKLLLDNQIPAVEVSDYTGFPEMMDGRVKTLHPKIHGGVLGRRGQDDEVMGEHGINPIDLVVVNLYPFAATVAKEDCHLPLAIETSISAARPWCAQPRKTMLMLALWLIPLITAKCWTT